MDLILRIAAIVGGIIAIIVNTLLNIFVPRKKPSFPPIRNKLLLQSVGELIVELRQRKITSVEIVQAYIQRIKEVDASLNAVIEDRFTDALKDAQRVDQLIAKTPNEKLLDLFTFYPLLGIPYTVKEACGLKGLSFAVGSIHRKNTKCPQNSEVVELLHTAGCIPLLVSANPEFCLSLETNTHINGKCLNPYDLRRSSAGSSGGEGSLNGAGASTFGLSTDIAGSIRLPALFCGVYGHKPTGGLVSIKGHFPYTPDPVFAQALQMGPITRFARDLPILLQIMAGKNATKLNFTDGFQTKDIKIHYAYGYNGLNGYIHPPTAFEMRLAIKRAVKYFERGGLRTKEVEVKHFKNSLEIALTGLLGMKDVPSIITQSHNNKPSTKVLFLEFIKSLIGHSLYTKEALFMELMNSVNAFMSENDVQKWRNEGQQLKQELLNLLGTDGVLFFPTYHTPATYFHTSIVNLVGIDMMLLFNVLGFPSTHVPLGVDRYGLPVGFQIIAAPFQDKLCLQMAIELESGFGGWEPPIPHEV